MKKTVSRNFGRERDWNIAYPVTIRVLGSIPATPANLKNIL